MDLETWQKTEALRQQVQDALDARNRRSTEHRSVMAAEDDEGPWAEVLDVEPDGTRWTLLLRAESRLALYERLLRPIPPRSGVIGRDLWKKVS